MTTTLIAVVGTSPAILSETLWALANDTPPVVPEEVVVVTTSVGEDFLRKLLLTANPDWCGRSVWECLRADLFHRADLPASHPGLQLSVQVIDLPNSDSGVREKALDIRTAAENAEAADFILRLLASHADAADRRVIGSIAGGRKTMGALLYAAMSLVGKEGDRVTHVLVSEPFEGCRGFFYPSQPVQALMAGPPEKVVAITAADAVIELADIPFVPLRNGFAEMNESRRSFAGLVTRYSRELVRPLGHKPRVALDVNGAVLRVEDCELSLTGRELLACAFLFLRAREGKPPYASQKAAGPAYLRFIESWRKDYPNHRALERLTKPAVTSDLSHALSILREKLEAKGLASTIPYLAPERSRVGFEIEFH